MIDAVNTEAGLPDSDGLPVSDGASLVESAFQALRTRILNLEIAPGAQLLEAELTALLGMSRTPVREALARLAHEGLVIPVPRRGIQVAPLTARDIREINRVLACLEVEAVTSLASRPLQQVEIEALDQSIAAMDAALVSGDLDAWGAADFRFHSLLFELCSNRHLRQTALLYLDKAHRARLVTLPLRRKPVYSNSNHAAVVEAIRRSDPETARDIHSAHKRRWSSELDQIIEQHPDIFSAGTGNV